MGTTWHFKKGTTTVDSDTCVIRKPRPSKTNEMMVSKILRKSIWRDKWITTGVEVTTSFITFISTIVCPKSPLNDKAKLVFTELSKLSLKWKLFYLFILVVAEATSGSRFRSPSSRFCSTRMAILGNWAKKTTLKWKWELPQAVKGNNVGESRRQL